MSSTQTHYEMRAYVFLSRHPWRTIPEDIAELIRLLDKARNWVQDPELRAEIRRIVPPQPRDGSENVEDRTQVSQEGR